MERLQDKLMCPVFSNLEIVFTILSSDRIVLNVQRFVIIILHFGGAIAKPSMPSIQGLDSPGARSNRNFCKRQAVNKNKLCFAIVSPMHLLRPVNIYLF